MKVHQLAPNLMLATAVPILLSSCGNMENSVKNMEASMKSTLEGKAMPADFPVPVYPGATVPGDGYREVLGLKTQLLVLNDDPAKVIEFYKTQLPQKGWSDVKELPTTPKKTVSASRKVEGKTEEVLIKADGEGISIEIVQH